MAGHERHQRALGAFLLASAFAHTALIIGLPDFLPQLDPPLPSVLEVTILAPQSIAAPAASPELAPARSPAQSRAAQPRPEPEKKAAPETTRPAASGAAPPVAMPQPQEADVAGSAGSSRAVAPAATFPEPAAEAAPRQVTKPIFDAAYLNNPEPAYPPAAVRAGQQGTVTLRVMVKRDGLPSRVEIEKSSGHRLLDTAAQDQVWSWRFAPARHGTDPVDSWVMVPVVFRLRDAR